MKPNHSTWSPHGISTEERSKLLNEARIKLLELRQRRNLTYAAIGREAGLSSEKVMNIANWIGTYETYQKICAWFDTQS